MIRANVNGEEIDPVVEMEFLPKEFGIFNGLNWYYFPLYMIDTLEITNVEDNEDRQS